jgi:peptidoglycan hydrolase CwlO-like protein
MMDTPDVEVLRQTIRTLQDSNKERYAEIAKLQAQMRTMRARITKLQRNIEQRNKGEKQ